MSRTLLSLAAVSPPELRDLLARATLIYHDGHRPLHAVAPLLVLSASPRPYGRAAVQVGAARIGLEASTYSPEEVRALGEWPLAAATIGRAAPALVLLGWEHDAANAFAAASPSPCLGVEGASGCTVGALADLLALERRGPLGGHRLTVVGDASPRALDLATGLASLGGSVSFVHPVGYAPDPERLTLVRDRAAAAGGSVLDTTELMEALRDSTAVLVEPLPKENQDRFRPYSLARHHIRVCKPGCAVMHRAHESRGAELSAALVDDGAWLAPSQRQAESLAAAALLGWMLQPDRVRSVLG
ncbi:hypothetical protein LBMAG42_35830 [Deltaproteobacteria bacterium]|nr:hypothetical protein LBMAG42_35830 [Deltaproteobacteria bacterium]